jgi:hypothetical protein
LPSKRTIYIGLACALAVGSIVFAYLYSPKKNNQGNMQVAASISAPTFQTTEEYNIDSDNDGLKDWEETLWGSDKNNADTDGDGTPDGAEIKASRNPLVKGPKDAINNKVASSISGTEPDAPEEKLTTTDKFTRDLFAAYMSMKQAGKTLTPEIENQLIESFIVRNAIGAPKNTLYLQTDFRINNDESAAALKAYGNTMGDILSHNKTRTDKPELAVIEEALDAQDPNALAEIDSILSSYQKTLQEMRGVRVPISVAELHAKLATDLAGIIAGVEGMKKVFSDPAATLVALDSYQKSAEDAEADFLNVKQYFSQRGISFDQKESGYMFVHISG